MPTQPPRVVIVLCLLAAALVVVRAQDRPTFRTGVQNIEVDVFVTDKDGRPVRGLTVDCR